MLQRLSEHLYLYPDLCNVYVVRSGRRALCIDFGLGEVLDALGDLGAEKLDWVLHTHHHRDQCQGTHRAVALGAKVAVPFTEHHFFTQAELFCNRRPTQNLYRMMADHFTLRESLPAAERLVDFTHFRWEDFDFQVLPTPGHTMGSISLRARIDGTWVVFSGDLIRSGAELQTLYDLQYSYQNADGFLNVFRSLEYLRERGAELLLPSHGEVIREPEREMGDLMQKIRSWMEFYPSDDAGSLAPPEIIEVQKNFHAVVSTDAHTYCLISQDGAGLFIDYGALRGQGYFQSFMHKGGEGNRFIPHSIRGLSERGLKKIEAFTPTHYHDDHLCGAPYLIREHDAELWAFENMVPHLEQPRRELLGCSLPEPLPVHRVLRDGERIRWHEYEFVVRYTPGHCDYHMTLFLEHDGERIVVSGDVLFNFGRRDTAGEILPHWNLIYLNKTDAEAHYRSARTLADFSPSVVCPGHGRPFRVNPRVLENFLSETARIKEHLAPFVGSRSLTEAMSPHFCQALPFEQRVQIGSPFAVTVRLTNFRQEAMNGRVRLATPAGWRVSPAERPLHVHAGSSQDLAFELVILERGPKELHYFPYGIGLELNGRDWGEVGQGQVEIE